MPIGIYDDAPPLVIVAPIPPTVNHAIGARGKLRFRSGKYKAFLNAMLAAVTIPDEWDTSRRFAVAVALHFNSKRKRDIDNRIKPLLDALTACGVWGDDSQVDVIMIRRGEKDKERPRAEVYINAVNTEFDAAFNILPKGLKC